MHHLPAGSRADMIERRVHNLIAIGEFRKAAELMASKPAQTQAGRMAAARLELEIGDTARAREQAEGLLAEHLDRRERACCMDIAGRAAARLGATRDGIRWMQKAMALAGEHDPALAAELAANYVKALLNWVGVEPALAELPHLHKAALVSGSRRAIVEYHLSFARIAAIRGWWPRADSEIRAAARLLEIDPSVDQLWRLHHVRSSICAKTFELEDAQFHAEQALALATMTGSRSFSAAALGNLAHLAAITGRYDPARDYVARTLALLSPSSPVRFALLSTQIDIGLWTRDHDYAVQAVAEGRTLMAAPDAQPSFYQLWFELHLVRWLMAQCRFEEAQQVARAALPSIERLADNNLLWRMRALAAEAMVRTGRLDDGRALVDLARLRVSEMNLETVAEMNRLAAVFAAAEGRTDDASRYLATASIVLSSAGLHGLIVDLERTQCDAMLPPIGTPQDVAPTTEAILESVALTLQFGRHPRVIGAHLIAVLDGLGVISSAAVTTDGAAGEPASGFSFNLGEREGRVYTLHVTPRAASTNAMLWLAIDRLIGAARQLANGPRANGEDSGVVSDDGSAHDFGMVVAAREMQNTVAITRRLASSNINVLITGETGTGKELLARGLHEASPRREAPFIPFNCTAFARDMLGAQLFGYRRGAFTGAHEAFGGSIRAAAGGTLFLDEIGEIGLDVQPKLLRFLESGEVHPLGESKPIEVDVRIVAATNADLERLVAEGRFREDLFYRLNVVRLKVPPLRERREEVPPLVHHFLARFAQDARKPGIRVADETLEYLVLYGWPGNVRQLANEVRRLVALAESGAVLMPEHLSPEIRASRRTVPVSLRGPLAREFVVRLDQPISAAVEHLERTMVERALKETDGRLEDAAQLLGLSRKGLYLKRQRLGIGDPARGGDSSREQVVDKGKGNAGL